MNKHLESAVRKLEYATKKRLTRDYREASLTEDEARVVLAEIVANFAVKQEAKDAPHD